ncbi:hypothetical protein HIM_03464 [Hirsutella minnesotensis 3608]|uniref:Acyltransferase MbtK/IucB-like conserved domain-containing protein n=1 Tax=Hirsutella minnesotensis 3608 TaxID=1043627 RepID=A0A0F7ZVS9_9HYPO|nr:hypothetical protein HIM_03464 [Hirsutella minnesotensis 3608]
MAPQVTRLPDGQAYSVSPVFAGVGFRCQGHDAHPHRYHVVWTVVLHTDEAAGGVQKHRHDDGSQNQSRNAPRTRLGHFNRPTLTGDSLFISAIASPPTSELRPAVSPTRQMAMILWITLYWYFHQPEPVAGGIATGFALSAATPPDARPVADWRVRVRPDGALRGRNLLSKLERMGLLASDNSVVDDEHREGDGDDDGEREDRGAMFPPLPLHPRNPFFSTPHVPTYYPPAPLQYVLTDGVRHPLRPRPPRMGEVFYSRFVPSVGQYLSFRVASSSPQPVPYRGPVGPSPPAASDAAALSDGDLLAKWHADPRVARCWGTFEPASLGRALRARHSFPVIGMWDGVPFGYFELYWVREDLLGRHLGGSDVGDWDRGVHIMIGENWSRGRVAAWLQSLVHWCFTADLRTMSVCLEPRVDNQRMLQHLDRLGFAKEKQVALPRKQSWFVRMRRECWDGPAL